MKNRKRTGLAAVLGVLAVGAVTASGVIADDWGVSREARLAGASEDLFGIAPLRSRTS